MKSSLSNATESIENKSLPSIPIRTSILKIHDKNQVFENYPQYEATPLLNEHRYKPCSNHSAPSFSNNLVYTNTTNTKNSLNSAESSSREGSNTSKDHDYVKANVKSQWSQKTGLRNIWSKIYQYDYIGNLVRVCTYHITINVFPNTVHNALSPLCILAERRVRRVETQRQRTFANASTI